uniref:Uncharacterized protein n=1 Tax=Chrysemys picta bellii TaxID=8478 RepID=A0A8C3P5C0_CHRPI
MVPSGPAWHPSRHGRPLLCPSGTRPSLSPGLARAPREGLWHWARAARSSWPTWGEGPGALPSAEPRGLEGAWPAPGLGSEIRVLCLLSPIGSWKGKPIPRVRAAAGPGGAGVRAGPGGGQPPAAPQEAHPAGLQAVQPQRARENPGRQRQVRGQDRPELGAL